MRFLFSGELWGEGIACGANRCGEWDIAEGNADCRTCMIMGDFYELVFEVLTHTDVGVACVVQLTLSTLRATGGNMKDSSSACPHLLIR